MICNTKINYTLKIKLNLNSNEIIKQQNLTKNQKFFLRTSRTNQSTYIPEYKVKSIQKMKAKHRSRINDYIDEISDSIVLQGLLKELNSEHGVNYINELREDFVYEERRWHSRFGISSLQVTRI